MKFKNIIFDLDGTITDSKMGIFRSLRYAFEKKGLEVPDDNKLNEFLGPPLIDSLVNNMKYDEKLATEIVELFRYRFTPLGIYENEMFLGMEELLRDLHQKKDFSVYMATAKPMESAKTVISYFKIDKYFEIVKGATFDYRIKSKSEVINSLLVDINNVQNKELELDKTVMIGDRNHDILGAKDHSLKSIGVTYGYGDVKELQDAKADYIVDSVNELRSLLIG